MTVRHTDSATPPFRPAALAMAGLTLAALLSACGGGGSDDGAASDAAAQATAPDAGIAALPAARSLDASADASADSSSGATQATDGATRATAQRASPVITAAAAATSVTCNIANFQAAVLARVNQYRAAGASCRTAGRFAATMPLTWNAKLLQAASGHSIDMATKNYFSHTSQDGRSFVDRINATGYNWSNIGENIAAGYPTVNAVVDGWMASDGHCRNLMNPAFKEVGAACVSNSGSTYKTYWTMDLARPR